MACEPIATGDQLLEAYPHLDALTVEEAEVAVEAATLLVSEMVGGRPLRRCSFDLRVWAPSDLCGPSVGYWPMHSERSGTIILPDGVTDVVAVTTNGAPVTGWRLSRTVAGLGLVPADGTSFSVPRTSSDALVVTVVAGLAPNRLARMAVLEVAADIGAKSLPSDCGMDPHVTYLAAQGVFMTFDADKDYDERFTSVVRLVSTFGGTSESAIYTPDDYSFDSSASDDVSAWA